MPAANETNDEDKHGLARRPEFLQSLQVPYAERCEIEIESLYISQEILKRKKSCTAVASSRYAFPALADRNAVVARPRFCRRRRVHGRPRRACVARPG